MNEEEVQVTQEEPTVQETTAVQEEKKGEETSVVSEESKKEASLQESNGNKKKGSNIFTISLLIIIVLLIGVIFILLLGGNSKNNEKKEDNINSENVENNNLEKENNEIQPDNNTNNENQNTEINNDNKELEKDIVSPEIINNLSSKFDKLFGDYIYILGENDNKSLFGRVLEEKVKFVEMENPPEDNDYAYFVGQLALGAVEKEYYDLFGEQLDTSIEYSGSCSKAYYDENRNLFIQKKYGCDKGWGWYVNGYRYKYTEDKNNAYIYVATAVYSGIGKVDVISDSDTNKVYKTIESDSFTIDESNYDSFAKYKVTFKKDGNNYFFKSVEKIEEGK